MPAEDGDQRVMRSADLLTGAVLLILGLVVVYLSWTMPRLGNRGIHPATVPGLVPGALGIALTLMGGILGWRSLGALRDPAGWRRFGAAVSGPETGRALAMIALALLYPLGLIGLVPFWLATAIFVFAFILLFQGVLTDAPKPLARLAFFAALQAVIVAGLIVVVFERGFLVRLP